MRTRRTMRKETVTVLLRVTMTQVSVTLTDVLHNSQNIGILVHLISIS